MFFLVIESKCFDLLYKQIDLVLEEFKKLVNEEVENNVVIDKVLFIYILLVVFVIMLGIKLDLNVFFVLVNVE